MNYFEYAARNKLRFGAQRFTAEQLFDLPLTSATGKANLNSIAIEIDEALQQAGARSFVASASTSPARTLLANSLEVVKAVIAIREAENARATERANKHAERAKLLDAIEQADRRELGAKSADELRKQLAALED